MTLSDWLVTIRVRVSWHVIVCKRSIGLVIAATIGFLVVTSRQGGSLLFHSFESKRSLGRVSAWLQIFQAITLGGLKRYRSSTSWAANVIGSSSALLLVLVEVLKWLLLIRRCYMTFFWCLREMVGTLEISVPLNQSYRRTGAAATWATGLEMMAPTYNLGFVKFWMEGH